MSLGQSPAPVAADAGWLKAVPADVDVAVRVRGVDAARADLMAMLKAMSPGWRNGPSKAWPVPWLSFASTFGESATKNPVGRPHPGRRAGRSRGTPPFAYPGP